MSEELRKRIEEIEGLYDGLRGAARVLRCDPGYLLRLKRGEKVNPSPKLLRKLGMKRKVSYVRVCDWDYDEDMDAYETTCGGVFQVNNGTPSDNRMAYCPYCGREIQEVVNGEKDC